MIGFYLFVVILYLFCFDLLDVVFVIILQGFKYFSLIIFPSGCSIFT